MRGEGESQAEGTAPERPHDREEAGTPGSLRGQGSWYKAAEGQRPGKARRGRHRQGLPQDERWPGAL